MARVLEFIAQEWLLVSVLLGLASLLMWLEARKGGAALSTAQLTQMVNDEQGVVLDVRDAAEFKAGHIVGALNIPHAKVQTQLNLLEKHKADPIIVVCKIGQHAGMVSKTLKAAGFERVFKLSGGMSEWQGSQLPVVKA
ncbi:MAG: rhodanese-like domain-containing protein [Pseudomonadales bacterium]